VDQNSSCVSYLWNGIPQLTRYVGFGLTDTPKCLCGGGGGGGGRRRRRRRNYKSLNIPL